MVAQSKSRIEGKTEFTKHMIRMRHAGQVNTRPEANEIILINSHDGASSYQMLAGVFRLCRAGHRRHTTAMHLLQSGVPFNVIALWLGHESMNTTHRYVEANLAMKEKALARLEEPDTTLRRFRASDALLKFLQSL
jgi:integrase